MWRTEAASWRADAAHTPSPPTKSFPTQSSSQTLRETPYTILRTCEFPPLRIKSLLESNPLKPKLLVGGLGIVTLRGQAKGGHEVDAIAQSSCATCAMESGLL